MSSSNETSEGRYDRPWILLAVFLLSAIVYVAFLLPPRFEHSENNHYAHLAASWLSGSLALPHDPPGTNDWACYDTEMKAMCPPGIYHFDDTERYRWYVSFPPFPAVLLLPAVALWGLDAPDKLIFALVAAAAPVVILLTLRRLRKRTQLKLKDELWLTAAYAFGSVFFFSAVQGEVWFAALIVASVLLALYSYLALDARFPLLAGLALGAAVLTRPTTALLALFFAFESLRMHRDDPEAPWSLAQWKSIRFRKVFRDYALFALPIVLLAAAAMWHNYARFEDVGEWGHTFLQIRWRDRIETWGLFNFHFFAKNLAIFTSSLPWLSREEPFVQISGHGLAFWVTSPMLMWIFWPKRWDSRMLGLIVAIVPVMLLNLCYQNSGWIQFGSRFMLDYLPLVFVLLALGVGRVSRFFMVATVLAIAINAFGAATFGRAHQYYVIGDQWNDMFQPD